MLHRFAVDALLGLAALLTFLCALGVASMRDPMQRLHYVAPPTTLSALLVTVAVFLDNRDPQAGIKSLLVTVLLVVMNGVVTHATARAARLRDRSRDGGAGGERIPIVGTGRSLRASEFQEER